MTDQLTPGDGLDQRIRTAVHDLVVTAPPAPAWTELANRTTVTAPDPGNRHRWWGAAAAAVVVALGVGALAYGVASRDDTTPAGTPTLPEPAPTVAPTTVTTPAPGTTPGPTAPTTPTVPATTTPTPPPEVSVADLFPAAPDPALSTSTAVAPSGSIDAAPGDIVTIGVDGDVWLHRGAFDPPQYGRQPDAPVRLVDGEDIRNYEGEMSPNVPSWIGGFVNGALIYGDCCEPAAGSVLAVSEPEGPRAHLGYGWLAAPDTSGRRWVTVNDFGVQLLDFTNGRGITRGLNLHGEYLNVQDVTWSADEREVWVLGWTESEGTVLARYAADTTLADLGRDVWGRPAGAVTPPRAEFVGRLADGTTVVAEYDQDTAATITGLRLVDTAGRPTDAPAPWTPPATTTHASLSPDGTTLAVVTADGAAHLLRSGESPVPWATDVSTVWFVTTPASPLGRADCPDTEPEVATWRFADLDGDGISERVVLDGDRLSTCGSPLELDHSLGQAVDETTFAGAIDVDADGRTEVWIGRSASTQMACVVLHRLDADGVLVPVSTEHCIGPEHDGFACVPVGGATVPVFYEATADGDVIARGADGTELGRQPAVTAGLGPHLFDLAC